MMVDADLGIAHEHATHAARLRMELAQSKREQRHYLKQVEIGKSLEKRKRKRDKEEAEGKVDKRAANSVTKSEGSEREKRRKLGEKGEREPWKGHVRERDGRDVAREKKRESDLDKVLGSIF
jgi:ESF2/ABP1 family protein